MSRTYRKQMIHVCATCEKPKYCTNTKKYNEDICTCREEQDHYGTRNTYYVEMLCHDHKHWMKPPRWFKQMRRQQERAQVKQALHNRVYKGKEFIPPVLNQNNDQWDWT